MNLACDDGSSFESSFELILFLERALVYVKAIFIDICFRFKKFRIHPRGLVWPAKKNCLPEFSHDSGRTARTMTVRSSPESVKNDHGATFEQ